MISSVAVAASPKARCSEAMACKGEGRGFSKGSEAETLQTTALHQWSCIHMSHTCLQRRTNSSRSESTLCTSQSCASLLKSSSYFLLSSSLLSSCSLQGHRERQCREDKASLRGNLQPGLLCFIIRLLSRVDTSSRVLQLDMLTCAWLFPVTRFNRAKAIKGEREREERQRERERERKKERSHARDMGRLAHSSCRESRGTEGQHLVQPLPPEALGGFHLQKQRDLFQYLCNLPCRLQR